MQKDIENNRLVNTHIRSLDGIRGFAILLVVTGHFFSKYYLFNFGWTGLNLFFVLSGYLITNRLSIHILSTKSRYFLNFYMRRFLRIFPLYYSCLVIFFLILPIFYIKYEQYFHSLYNIQIWYWLYISNWRIIWYGLPSNNLFFHFWSLAVEEQFYIVWPVFYFLILTFNKRIILIFTVFCVSISVRLLSAESQTAYYNTLTACEPLIFGCFISIMQAQNKLNRLYKTSQIPALLSFISFILIIFKNQNPHMMNRSLMVLGYLNIDLIWAFTIITVLIHPYKISPLNKFFSSKIIVQLGIYSYGIYIFHWIFLQAVVNKYEIIFNRMGYNEIFTYWIVRLFGLVLTLFVSILSYRIYENKFLNLKKYFI